MTTAGSHPGECKAKTEGHGREEPSWKKVTGRTCSGILCTFIAEALKGQKLLEHAQYKVLLQESRTADLGLCSWVSSRNTGSKSLKLGHKYFCLLVSSFSWRTKGHLKAHEGACLALLLTVGLLEGSPSVWLTSPECYLTFTVYLEVFFVWFDLFWGWYVLVWLFI